MIWENLYNDKYTAVIEFFLVNLVVFKSTIDDLKIHKRMTALPKTYYHFQVGEQDF